MSTDEQVDQMLAADEAHYAEVFGPEPETERQPILQTTTCQDCGRKPGAYPTTCCDSRDYFDERVD